MKNYRTDTLISSSTLELTFQFLCSSIYLSNNLKAKNS